MDPAAESDVDLRRYARGLVRRKWTVALLVAIAVVTALALSLVQTPRYEGRAEVALQSSASQPLFNQGTPPQTDPQVSVSTEIQVIESPPVQAAVTAKLGVVGKVSASQVGQTLVIAIRGYATTAKRAASVANGYAAAYLDLSKASATATLTDAEQQIKNQIAALQSQIDALDAELAGAPASRQASLTASRTSVSAQQDMLRQQLSEVQLDISVASGGAVLVASASPASSPVAPKPLRNVILAVLAGLLVGVGVACLGEFLDDTIRTLDDVERFRPLPVLAHIPTMEGRSTGPTPRVALREGRDTPAAEAYRSLRTAVQLLGVVRPLTVVQFTSSTAGEGKTTTVANLAAVLAGAGRRVVIVDCDMRRPQLHEVFDLPNEVGLTSVLVGEASVSDALQAADGFPGLSVLTSGARAPNPSELLSLKQTSEIIFALQARFDFVLLDSPPVLPVTDAVVLSEWVEAVIVVTAAGVTKRKALRRALQALAQTAAPVRGLVLNRAALEPAYSYAYTAPIPRQPAAPQG